MTDTLFSVWFICFFITIAKIHEAGYLKKKKRGLLEAEGETTLRNLKQGP